MSQLARMRRQRAPFGALCIFISSAIAVMAGQAEARIAIALSPQIVEKIVTPASTINDVISYTNKGTDPMTVTVQVMDFETTDDGKVTEIPAGTHPTSLVPYLKISPIRLDVAPGQRVYFRYSLKTPDQFTHLRSMVFFRSRPSNPPKGRAVAVFVPRMGVPVYVENRRAVPATLDITAVKWERVEADPASLKVRISVRNTGQRILRPGGRIETRSTGGRTRLFQVNEGGSPVLPGQTRTFEADLGAVGDEALSLKIRMQTSLKASFEADYKVEAAGSSGSPS